MTDINTLVDNILLSRAVAEDNKRFRRSAAVNKAADIIVPFLIAAALPFLIAAALVIVVFIVASI